MSPMISESFRPGYSRVGYREGELVAMVRISPEISPLDSQELAVFDLEADPLQTEEMPPADARVAAFTARARQALQRFWMRWPDRFEGAVSAEGPGEESPAVEGEGAEQLRALGYVQ